MAVISTCELGGLLKREDRDFEPANYQYDLVSKVFVSPSSRETIAWMEMGTGKTIAAILCMAYARGSMDAPRILIICPSSLKLSVWRSELNRCTDFAASVVYKSRSTDRPAEGSICVVSYTEVGRMFTSGWQWVEDAEEYTDGRGFNRKRAAWVRNVGSPFLETKWDLVIMDESHAMRNPDRKISTNQAARQATARSSKVVLLTGTPVQNGPLDICGQFLASSSNSRLTDKKAYGDRGSLPAWVVREVDARSHKVSLDQAGVNLPPKTSHNVYIDHGLAGRPLEQYNERLMVARTIPMGEKATLAQMEMLRDCLSSMRALTVEPSAYYMNLENNQRGEPIFDGEVIARVAADPGAKVKKVFELYHELLETHQKVVIASDSVRALKVMQAKLFNKTGTEVPLYDGELDPEAKDRTIRSFLGSPDSRCLLLSLIAGGEGLNLVPGPTAMIIFSFWYNPAKHRQLEARIHRRGQTQEVHIYNVISRYSIEEAILKLHTDKTKCSEMILSGNSGAGGTGLSWKQMRSIISECKLLKSGAGIAELAPAPPQAPRAAPVAPAPTVAPVAAAGAAAMMRAVAAAPPPPPPLQRAAPFHRPIQTPSAPIGGPRKRILSILDRLGKRPKN